MFTIKFEYPNDTTPLMTTRVYEAREYSVVGFPDGSRDVVIPNENDVGIHHSGFSRAFVMNDAGATIDKIDNRGSLTRQAAHELPAAAA